MPRGGDSGPPADQVRQGQASALPADLGFPPCPPAELDPLLDAALACFLRFGVRKTTVQDVAVALGVNRTTVYRQVGAMDEITRQLTARELHRHLGEAYRRTAVSEPTPEALVRLLAEMVRLVRHHPLVEKILRDERELVGRYLQSSSDLFDGIAALITPALAAAVQRGHLAPRDPELLAQWVARIAVTTVIAAPAAELESFFEELLLPALSVER